MDPEEKKLLEETLALSKENNKMLRELRNARRWGVVWTTIKWVIILGITVGSFYYLEPYINQVRDIYNSIDGYMPR